MQPCLPSFLNVDQHYPVQFFRQTASRSKIFSLFQVDLMNLFETNRLLAVKLNQSINELYSLPLYEYLSYVKFLVNESGENSQQTFEIQTGLDD